MLTMNSSGVPAVMHAFGILGILLFLVCSLRFIQ